MEKELLRNKMFEIRLKIAYLPLKERENTNHPFYKELEIAKRMYARLIYEEKMKESEKNDQYKRK